MKRWLENLLFIAVIGIVSSISFADSLGVVLSNDVHVTGTTVRLADLLPPNARNDLRKVSSVIELGQAPQPGSTRVYDGFRIAEILKAHPEIARRVTIPDRILIRRSTYAITATAVHDAVSNYLTETGQRTDLSDLVLQPAGGMASLEPNPTLQVRKVNWDSAKHQYEFRLHCVKLTACRDFLVYVQDPHKRLALPLKTAGRVGGGLAKGTLATSDANPVLIPAGSRIRMVMQGDGMQISLTVTSLESGRAGQKIRVRSNRQTLLAEVVSRNLVWSKMDS
jgi:hypothetical protein